MHKKFVLMLICLSLLLTLNIKANGEEIEVSDFVQKVSIGQANIDLPSIVYNNENYVKLRDFSILLTNIDKDFKLLYNNKNKQISAITAYPYEPIGDELQKLDKVKSATISDARFDIDNINHDLSAILIAGHNYFRLRDLAEVFNIEITYDISERTVYMEAKDMSIEKVEAGTSLNYKTIETKEPLNKEGYVYKVKDGKLTITFSKQFNTGGYQLRCERVVYDGKDVVIRPLVISPPTDAMVTQVISYPNCTIEVDVKGVDKDFGVKVVDIEANTVDK